MANNLALNLDLIGDEIPKRVCGISILVIDNDTTSIASLTSILEQFSVKVMNVNVTSTAVSIIEKQSDIGLVIANIETPHIDSYSFLTALLHKDIPLILIYPEVKEIETSEFLKKVTRFCLKKPISENDIKSMWQHVLPEAFRRTLKLDDYLNNDVKQIEAFGETFKRQTTNQSFLLRKRPSMETFTTSKIYEKIKSIANAEWETKPMCSIETEVKREGEIKVESNIGRRIWTHERHMKFLSAISILGDKDSHPKSILKIMDDKNLTPRQVASHLQKYKAKIAQTSDTSSKNEWRPTKQTFENNLDYKSPFSASNRTTNLISGNSSVSTSQFNEHTKEKNTQVLKLGGILDLTGHPFFDISNKPSVEVDFIPPVISNNPPYNGAN